MWSEWVKKVFTPPILGHHQPRGCWSRPSRGRSWRFARLRLQRAETTCRHARGRRRCVCASRCAAPPSAELKMGLLLARARSSAPSVLSLKLGSSVTLGGSWLTRLHLAARGRNDVPSRAWPSAGGVRVRLVETLRHGPARRPAGSAPRPCSFAPRRCSRCRWRWWGRPSRSAARVRPGCACSSRSRRRRRARGRRRCACAARPCPSAKWRCSPRPSAWSWLRSVVGFPGSACSA